MRLLFPILLASSLSAQWLHYPTAGVPKTRDGKPNLAAPAPKTADRKPDLTGMWFNLGNEGSCPQDIKGDSGECIEKGLGIGDVSLGLPKQAVNIADGLAGGLPFTPWAVSLMKERAAAVTGDPHLHCLPPSFPRAYALPHIQKFIQTPGLVVILDEFNASYRQIFTDGRPLPEDPQPSWNGYSSGKWEGDTLVAQTIGFRDDLWLDLRGAPLTNAAKMTERFRRPDFGHLDIEVTVDDPKAYTKPWTVKFRQAIVLDTELIDEICAENEKSMQHMGK
ncbi:MAG: hypothetical protein ACRD4E_04145 [Bryobacteraceae bacterium]